MFLYLPSGQQSYGRFWKGGRLSGPVTLGAIMLFFS